MQRNNYFYSKANGSKIINKINPLILNKENYETIENFSLNGIKKYNNYLFEVSSNKASNTSYKRINKFDKNNFHSIRTLLTEEYFSWRYGAHPYFNYMITKIKFNNDRFDHGAIIWRLVNLSNGKKIMQNKSRCS